MIRAVAIGGGHGLARSLAALREVAGHTTAIVTVADDGGSSGRLRRDLGVAPPGDLRMALAAMADNRPLASLMQYRFRAGELDGHALGNLLIVALADTQGRGLVQALDVLCEELGVLGRVLPCTTTPLVLHADTGAGQVDGQVAVATGGPPSRLWLEPDAPAATPGAVTAIEEADLVVLGPGSVFTSILPNLLVPDIGAAVARATAPVVLVANMREQLGETEGLTLADHVERLQAHVPGLVIDAIVAHDGPPPRGGGRPLAVGTLDSGGVAGGVGRVIRADLLDGHDGHDPGRLAQALRVAMTAPASADPAAP